MHIKHGEKETVKAAGCECWHSLKTEHCQSSGTAGTAVLTGLSNSKISEAKTNSIGKGEMLTPM